VESDGQLSGKRILQNIEGTDLAKQVLEFAGRVKWIPGKCNGKPVPVIYKLPVNLEFR